MQVVHKPIQIFDSYIMGHTMGHCNYSIGNNRQLLLFLDRKPGEGIVRSRLNAFFMRDVLSTFPNHLSITSVDGLPPKLSAYASFLEGRFHIVHETTRAFFGASGQPFIVHPRFSSLAPKAELIRSAVHDVLNGYFSKHGLTAGKIILELGILVDALVITDILVSGFFRGTREIDLASACEIMTGEDPLAWHSAKAA